MSETYGNGHLDRERLASLLDEPGADEAAAAHLDGCERCRAEYEALSRMRMALSGLGELEPPADGWRRLEAELEERELPAETPAGGEGGFGPVPGGRSGRRAAGVRFAGPALQAAAAVLLFAGGILAGFRLTGEEALGGAGSEAGGPLAVGTRAEGTLGPATEGGEEAARLRRALEELDRFGALGLAGEGEEPLDPASAAERLARLDALIGASREAVSEDPADPVANTLLFRLVEQREELASRLNRSVHLTGLEYR